MKKLNAMNDTDILESFKEIFLELGSLDEMGWFQEVKKLQNTINKEWYKLKRTTLFELNIYGSVHHA